MVFEAPDTAFQIDHDSIPSEGVWAQDLSCNSSNRVVVRQLRTVICRNERHAHESGDHRRPYNARNWQGEAEFPPGSPPRRWPPQHSPRNGGRLISILGADGFPGEWVGCVVITSPVRMTAMPALPAPGLIRQPQRCPPRRPRPQGPYWWAPGPAEAVGAPAGPECRPGMPVWGLCGRVAGMDPDLGTAFGPSGRPAARPASPATQTSAEPGRGFQRRPHSRAARPPTAMMHPPCHAEEGAASAA